MTTRPLFSALFAAMLLAGTAGVAFAQEPAPEDEDLHHPGQVEGAPAPEAVAPGEEAAGMPGGMPGMTGMMPPQMMQMMTPEMMQMMQGMMAMMQGQGGEAGGAAAMGCPMMRMMAAAMQPEMPGMMMGDAMPYGMPYGDQQEMTPERVRALLEEQLARHANPRLAIGEIATAADGSITAEIVTVDGSLVQKLAFNRYPGLYRLVTE